MIAIIAQWIEHYNEECLRAVLGYLMPAEFYRGIPAARVKEPRAKLARGRQERRQIKQQAGASRVIGKCNYPTSP